MSMTFGQPDSDHDQTPIRQGPQKKASPCPAQFLLCRMASSKRPSLPFLWNEESSGRIPPVELRCHKCCENFLGRNCAVVEFLPPTFFLARKTDNKEKFTGGLQSHLFSSGPGAAFEKPPLHTYPGHIPCITYPDRICVQIRYMRIQISSPKKRLKVEFNHGSVGSDWRKEAPLFICNAIELFNLSAVVEFHLLNFCHVALKLFKEHLCWEKRATTQKRRLGELHIFFQRGRQQGGLPDKLNSALK